MRRSRDNMEKEQEEEEYREHSGGVRREGVERTKK